jgi:hypothetical protein
MDRALGVVKVSCGLCADADMIMNFNFLTSCTRLHMYRSLKVIIPSAGSCVQSCGHSRSFSVLDHVKSFMIVSASLICTKNCAEESTTFYDIRTRARAMRRMRGFRVVSHHLISLRYRMVLVSSIT